MFICQFSGKIAPAGTRCNRIITKRRKVEYPFRSKVNRKVNHEEERIEWTPDKGGEGYEIVQEINVCDEFLKDALVMYTFEKTIGATEKQEEIFSNRNFNVLSDVSMPELKERN